MPTGRYGERTFLDKTCPICKEIFTISMGNRKKTCSRNCGQALRTAHLKKEHAKWSVNKVKEEKKKEIRNVINEKKLHLNTMFVGGHDGSIEYGNDCFVTCNEGEIL